LPVSFGAQAATAGTYGTFAIDAAGAWTYSASSAHNEFAAGSTYTDTFSVASADGTMTAVTINIHGTNDAAVLSADTKNLTETNLAADISTAGTLTVSHVDRPASPTRRSSDLGTYGTFAIDAAGAWTYSASSAHNEFAAGSTYTDTFSVASADGTMTAVTINIHGTNDAAVLSADTKNLTETNLAADISTAGTLTVSHVDRPASPTRRSSDLGTYGTFAIDSAGAWTYTASSAHNEFAAGSTYSDTFSVASADGTRTAETTYNLDTRAAPVLSPATKNLTETNLAADIPTASTTTDEVHHPRRPGRRYSPRLDAPHHRRRLPSFPPRRSSDLRHLRHLRDRQRRRLDLHGELGAQRVCRRLDLQRHVLGRQRRRHADGGDHVQPRHTRSTGTLSRHEEPDRNQPSRRYSHRQHDHRRSSSPSTTWPPIFTPS